MGRFCLRFLVFVPLLITALSSYAKPYSCNLDLCPADTIIISNNPGSGGGDGPESVSVIPITCILTDSGASLQFGFLDDLGFVTVTLMNLSTGEIESGVLDSQLGIVYFPFSGDVGFYRLLITTSSGGFYHGSFYI